MTKTVDQWAAEQCGVKVTRFDPENDQLEQYWEYKGKTYDGKWTMKFADCLEIVREHFSLITEPFGKNTWQCSNRSSPLFGYGKTIAEAECNCITAIFEASQ